MEMIQVQYYQSPYGELIFGSFEGKLCMCDWVNEKRREVIDKRLQKALHADYCTQGSEVIAKAILSWKSISPAKGRHSTSHYSL